MKITMHLQALAGGGAERIAVLLANALAEQGHAVTMLLVRKDGVYFDLLAPNVQVRFLPFHRTLFALPFLAWHMLTRRPDAVISHLTHVNVSTILAGLLVGRARRVMVVEHNQITRNFARLGRGAVQFSYKLVSRVYPFAGAVVAVSDGVSEDLQDFVGQTLENLTVIHNPVITYDLHIKAGQPADHPWLVGQSPIPVFIGMGRLNPQKDFDNLLRAFAELRKGGPARLIILGKGPDQDRLEALAHELGVGDHVDFAGFVANPYAYIAKSSCFVLSSAWEGLPTALIEAMACGTPVVSTDCKSGPRIILEGGRHGRLVPPGDHLALAEAMRWTLTRPGNSDVRLARAMDFTADRAASAYQDRIAAMIAPRRAAKPTPLGSQSDPLKDS